MVQNRVGDMTGTATLYQGGTLDNPITSELSQPGGTYAQTWPSKYGQIFDRAGHMAWTDGVLAGRFHNQMNYYHAAFFDAFLNNGSLSKLQVKKSRVSTLAYQH